ncbi:hypothetical protein Golob_019613 [Gossypium lobatum]|uniref:Uncharacterized protein n=1 Tax=Gossypium lobatum TaxID=34289 RepID=A0A7J8L7Y2_9ROSI|nr:hypothetical protein [Gossypium lobatum]
MESSWPIRSRRRFGGILKDRKRLRSVHGLFE